MNKKYSSYTLILKCKMLNILTIIFFCAFSISSVSCKGNNPTDTLETQQEVLIGVGMFLQRGHYSPKEFNDKYAEQVFDYFIKQSLDPEKIFFLQSDIQQLSRYKNQLDDEIKGLEPMAFYPAAIAIFKQRIAESEQYALSLLQMPFKFMDNDYLQVNRDSAAFPISIVEKKQLWQQRMKWQVLAKYYELMRQKEKADAKDPIKKKSEQELEKEAREKVKLTTERYFKRFKGKAFDVSKQFELYLNAVCTIQDPHTSYLPPLDKRDFDLQMGNKVIGIGAQLRDENGEIKIVSVVTGGPAWKSKKIAANDIISKVSTNNEPFTDLAGYDINDAIKLIRGTEGSRVNLVIKKPSGKIDTVRMLREKISIDEANARGLVFRKNGKKIGYLYVPEFYQDFQDRVNGASVARDVKNEILKMKAENIDGLLVDLRFNTGGSLSEVIKMVGYFIPEGPVVRIRNREGKEETLRDTDPSILYDGPLAVMINEFSASASEIFAAAIQDYHRGIIIGSSSHGKGTVQVPIDLGKRNPTTEQPEFGSLKLTIQKFYRINGSSTQAKGVEPDIALPNLLQQIKSKEKNTLYALPYDKINSAGYNYWIDDYNLSVVKQQSQQRVRNNQAFTAVQNLLDWNKQNENKLVPLQFDKYKQEQLENLKKFNKEDSITYLKNPIDGYVMPADSSRYYHNKDKGKQDFYQKWFKNIRSDIYVEESTNIVIDMIVNKNRKK